MKRAVATPYDVDGAIIERPGGLEVNGVFFALDLEAIDAEAEADIAAGHVYDHEDVMWRARERIREQRRQHAARTATSR